VDGITIFRIPPVGPNDVWKKWQMLLPAFSFLVRRRKEYDVLFVPGFNALGISALLAAKIFGKRCVFRAVNPGELSGAYSLPALQKGKSLSPLLFFIKLVLRLKKRLLEEADRFVATTKELEEDFLSNGVDSERIVRIPNGVDTALYHPVSLAEKLEIRHRLGIPTDKVIVIYVGRLVRWKGALLLVKVWPKIIRDHLGAHLYLVGSGVTSMDDCEAELKDFVCNQGLSKSVTFTGGVENVHEYLKAADVFTSPAEYEAFGITVIEAMASGVPLVVTAVGGMKETVRSQEHGFSIPPNDLESLYKSLVTLIGNASLRGEMGRASRIWVEQRFSIESIAERYSRLFKSLTS